MAAAWLAAAVLGAAALAPPAAADGDGATLAAGVAQAAARLPRPTAAPAMPAAFRKLRRSNSRVRSAIPCSSSSY
jgi:hypothetical protein